MWCAEVFHTALYLEANESKDNKDTKYLFMPIVRKMQLAFDFLYQKYF